MNYKQILYITIGLLLLGETFAISWPCTADPRKCLDKEIIENVKIDTTLLDSVKLPFFKKSENVRSSLSSNSCCTPPQWVSTGVQLSAGVQKTTVYYYDSVNYRNRVDTTIQQFPKASQSFTTIALYPNTTAGGDEWVIDNNANTCEPTGPDQYNQPCFGDAYGLPYVGSTVLIPDSNNGSEVTVSIYANKDNGISYFVSQDCLPVTLFQAYQGTTTVFYNSMTEISDSAFDVPAICSSSSA
ncbi:hypothetical protein CYY_008898 [Polysphondylium violaceum]|uniref:Uncharacterized protein n=1 Tax=Polysphondylium violaceum TaxID=133409 RepID=A0A8J4PKW1_9MYCE|nr:hypothetical protein CYY_008898 [Polysphondylium violaceum]